MDIFRYLDRFFINFNGEKGEIGKSVMGLPIYYFKVQKSEYPKLIVQATIHAREYITTYLTLKLIKDFAMFGKIGCVYFVPMLNPDGVKISLNKQPLYKANARGVDLNVNFDARFGSGAKNVFSKASENYVGKHAFSEPESIAIRDFTLKVMPDATISYHSKGQEIYYEFFQGAEDLLRDFNLAKRVAKVTDYTIKSTPNSAGGYKDWCIEKLKIPALTIEVGNDDLSHPIGKEHLLKIYKQNKKVIKVVLDYLTEIQCKKNLWKWLLKKP